MRRIADLHAGEAKTAARDAAIIAEAARSMPRAPRTLRLADDTLAELMLPCGFDDHLVAQITQLSNRLQGLLTQIHPALKRMRVPRLDHSAVLDLLQRYPTPAALAAVSGQRLIRRLKKLAPRMAERLAPEIYLSDPLPDIKTRRRRLRLSSARHVRMTGSRSTQP